MGGQARALLAGERGDEDDNESLLDRLGANLGRQLGRATGRAVTRIGGRFVESPLGKLGASWAAVWREGPTEPLVQKKGPWRASCPARAKSPLAAAGW